MDQSRIVRARADGGAHARSERPSGHARTPSRSKRPCSPGLCRGSTSRPSRTRSATHGVEGPRSPASCLSVSSPPRADRIRTTTPLSSRIPTPLSPLRRASGPTNCRKCLSLSHVRAAPRCSVDRRSTNRVVSAAPLLFHNGDPRALGGRRRSSAGGVSGSATKTLAPSRRGVEGRRQRPSVSDWTNRRTVRHTGVFCNGGDPLTFSTIDRSIGIKGTAAAVAVAA